jgi:hypothetical protein
MTATATAGPISTPRHYPVGQLVRRATWLAFAAGLIAVAVVEVGRHHLGLWPIVAFVIAPDLSFLAGAGIKTEPGQLAPRAVPIYNFVHRPIVPLALMAAAAFGLVPMLWFVAGLSWLAHISIDHAAGYGLRTADGWQQ